MTHHSSQNLPQQDKDLIRAHWASREQPWRNELEISPQRQQLLIERLAIIPDPRKGRYPFRFENDETLTRADLEWLIANHEDNGIIGPVDCTNKLHKGRIGLDLRGARVEASKVSLAGLPLQRMQSGLRPLELSRTSSPKDIKNYGHEREMAAIHLENVDISYADLQEAELYGAYLEGADLREAILTGADLQGANINTADFGGANLNGANLSAVYANRAFFIHSTLTKAICNKAYFHEAVFVDADLTEADFTDAHLENADLNNCGLERARFNNAHMEGCNLQRPYLAGTCFRGVFFDNTTIIVDLMLSSQRGEAPLLGDIRWQKVNLSKATDWQSFIVGEEQLANQRTEAKTLRRKSADERAKEFTEALHTNRQLERALQTQGMSDVANHFAYRAQVCQQKASWFQKRYLSASWSLFLDMLAGYGYYPRRSFFLYLVSIGVFALLFLPLGMFTGNPINSQFSFWDALYLSITSFHGRGFFPGNIELRFPGTLFAAIEAAWGLLVEVSFIAAFTQRYLSS